MINEHDLIALTEPLPTERLEAGDVGTVVFVHAGGEAFIVEFMTLLGETVALPTLLASQVRPLCEQDMSHVRELVPSALASA